MQAKNTLGEAFGTKKIKQQIKSVERNAVNVSTLDSIAGILHDSIAAKTSALPSKGTKMDISWTPCMRCLSAPRNNILTGFYTFLSQL
jgi:DNA-directed RNA polymerase I subunit RPA49